MWSQTETEKTKQPQLIKVKQVKNASVPGTRTLQHNPDQKKKKSNN